MLQNCASCFNGSYYSKDLRICYAHGIIVANKMVCGKWEGIGKTDNNTCKDCPFGGQDCVYCRVCPYDK